MRRFFSLLLCLSVFSAVGQNNDENEIGVTIDRFLRYLSFSDSSSLKIDSLHTVFVSDGKLTANFGKKPLTFTVHQYTESMRNNMKSGQVYSATEKELARKVDVFGKIAHVLSTYELSLTAKTGTITRRGINSIQLLNQDGKWLILSVIWDRESDTLKLPPKYLSN